MKSVSKCGWPESRTGQKADEKKSLMYVKYLYQGTWQHNAQMNTQRIRVDNKFTSTYHAYVRYSRSKSLNVCKYTTHSVAHPAFKVALEKEEGWRERAGLET